MIKVKNISKIELTPLEGKHYQTELQVWVNGNNWDDDGLPFQIAIAGTGTKPSIRELEKGYYPDEGMNHVESKEHLMLAEFVLEAIMEKLND